MISLIVACSLNRVIGKNGKLPWHIPEDLKFFKQKTIGKPMIMGRVTFESLPQLLPEREHLIITRQRTYTAPHVKIFHTFEDALQTVQHVPEIMVIGGMAIFQIALPYAHRIYMTRIHTIIEDGDTFFPNLGQEWKEIHHTQGGQNLEFITFEKNT